MTKTMVMVFETDDLSQASPATVSRCGMVYLEPSILNATDHLESWMKALEPLLRS